MQEILIKCFMKDGVTIIQKPFAIGARIEHPQELINKSQYKEFYNHPKTRCCRL